MHGRGGGVSSSVRVQYILLGVALGFVLGHAVGRGLFGGGHYEVRTLKDRVRQLQDEHEARDSEVVHMRSKLHALRKAGGELRAQAAGAEHALHDMATHAKHAEEVEKAAEQPHPPQERERETEHEEEEEERHTQRREAAKAQEGEDADDSVSAPYDHRGLDLPLLRAKNGTIIVIPVNLGYLGFGLNLVCSLRKLRITNYVLLAMDGEVLTELLERKLPVFADPDLPFISSKAAQWADPNFHRLVCTKLVTVTNLLRKGLNVVLSDADIVWREAPWKHFRWDLSLTFSIGSCHRELPDNKDLSRDKVAKLNTGFYFAQPQAGVIDLYSRAYQICKRGTLTGDQPAINTVIHQDLSSGRPQYSYGFFDGCLFANGCVFFKHLCQNTTRPDPVLVHANYIVGRKRKIKSLAKHGLWDDECVAALGGAPGLPPRESKGG
eukprot:Hpha_TRINITY_DN20850_c0_g1::TRINITY_DN20850_c0_g1_i1::g.85599::m.85599